MTIYCAVRKALKGLLIPDLQDIVLEYLPDRGLLEIPTNLIRKRMVFYPNSWRSARFWASLYFERRIPFYRKLRYFERFELDFTEWLPKLKECQYLVYRVSVIYLGESGIIEIH
jgi:hypothetical protein